MNNGFSTGEEDSRGGHTDQTCCLIDENERCRNSAGNASYSKRIQKTTIMKHFKTIPIKEKEIITYFVYMVKSNSNKLDLKNGPSNDTT
uniref:Histone deacetylase complex subunit SAP30 zinc-finger domain-containing protein n=1 Tax=Glossina brevipalpis TaxID=37001 RepID=A0A1A9W692_9MUSC